jgi:hypothetical protein
MLEYVKIDNFKSIEHIEFSCSKFNLFTGIPDAGKSNVLEALAFFSLPYILGGKDPVYDILKFLRVSSPFHLLHRFNGLSSYIKETETIDIITNMGRGSITSADYGEGYYFMSEGDPPFSFFLSADNILKDVSEYTSSPFKYYEFNDFIYQFREAPCEYLLPPDGMNLFRALDVNRNFRNIMGRTAADFGYDLVLSEYGDHIEIQSKAVKNRIIVPYTSFPSTLRKLFLYVGITAANKNSILIFEEPELSTTPKYLESLLNLMQYDQTNQYFITVKSHYFLQMLLDSVPEEQLSIFNVFKHENQSRLSKAHSFKDKTALLQWVGK